MFNKFFALAITGLTTAGGTAVLTAPLTQPVNAQSVNAQPQKFEPAVVIERCSGHPPNRVCLPKDGKFLLMPPGYSPGVVITPPRELPKPSPRPGNESLPSINIR